MNLIFGTAGFAKEVDWLISDIYDTTGTDYRTDYFVAEEGNMLIGKTINGAEVIGEPEVFRRALGKEVNCFVAIGSPRIKELIVDKIKATIPMACFPNLIHPDVTYDKRPEKVVFGEGNIICSKTVLTTDIQIGSYVHLNLDCTVGHDSTIGNYSTISPGVHISGNVTINKNVFVGTGAVILEKLSICEETIIGAGATLTKNAPVSGTYVGSPARKIK